MEPRRHPFQLYGVVLLCLGLSSSGALASPRLIETFPPSSLLVFNPNYPQFSPEPLFFNTGRDANGPLTFIFSEPMDPSSVVVPGIKNSNPNRSYELVLLKGYNTPQRREIPLGNGGEPMARENGRMIEVLGSSVGASFQILRIFRNGFQSVKGEPLDRDYEILFGVHDAPQFAYLVRAVLPAPTQATSDPEAPISIYFTEAQDPSTLDASLTAGDGGPVIGPLAYHWDLFDPARPEIGGIHLTVQHPALVPSPRPYVFTIHQLFTRYHSSDFMPLPYVTRFTLGPALAGDLNDDGEVGIADVTRALQGALGLVQLSEAQRFAADIAPRQGTSGRSVGDGKVDLADVTRILQRAVGLVPDDQWP